MDKLTNFSFDSIFTDIIDYNNKLRTAKNMVNSNGEPYVRPLERSSASSAGTCHLLRFYREAGLTQPIDDFLHKIFYHGNLIHDVFAKELFEQYFGNVLKDKRYTVINEYPFEDKLETQYGNISYGGYIDNLILFRQPREETVYCPIEIKSIGNKFRKIKDEPKYEHKIQLMLYLYVLNAEFGYIVYIDKSKLQSKTIRVDFDQKWFNEHIVDREAQYYYYKRTGETPLPEAMIKRNNLDYNFSLINDQCVNCEFHDSCVDVIKND